MANGKHNKSSTPKWRRDVRSRFDDDEFSNFLRIQGDDGRKMRILYLMPWPMVYMSRVNDEPLHD